MSSLPFETEALVAGDAAPASELSHGGGGQVVGGGREWHGDC